MRKIFVAGMLAAMMVPAMFWMSPRVAAQGVSQVILSCTTPPPQSSSTNGCRSLFPIFSPTGELLFVGGFWVWCQNSTDGTPYGPDCAGAVYIEEVNLTTHTGVYETTSVSGTTDVPGQVEFNSSDGDLKCTLSLPAALTRGATNTLSGSCNGQPVTFTNVVVQVT
jgi:hypothetical protein